MKFYIIIFVFFTFLSCSVDPQDLESAGKYEKALELYKEMLAEDYKNQHLRVRFTLCYFKNASKHIDQNNLEEAQRNIERGMIYNQETNPDIKNQYANVILSLGKKFVEIGNLDGDVESKKKFQKGYDLIERSAFLLDDNTEAKKILDELNNRLSEKYYLKSRDLYYLWQENKRNKTSLTESLKLIDNALIFNPENKNAKELNSNILEKLLFESMKDQDMSFRIVKIYHNTQTGFSAFKIRFYNDHSQDIVISPDQFTLYDDNGVPYKFDKESSLSGNYTGLLNRKRISPSRFTNGLLVFNTGKKNPILSSLIWKNSNGRVYEKEFPHKKLVDMIEQ